MQLSKTQVSCLIASAVGIGLGAAYYFYRQEVTEPTKDEEPAMLDENLIQSEIVTKSAIVRNLVAKDLQGEVLDRRTIAMIYDLLSTKCSIPYHKVLLLTRGRRRKVIHSDMASYEKIVIDASNAIETLISSQLELILEEFGLDMEIFEASNMHWARQNPNFALLGVIMLEEMRNRLPTKNKEKAATMSEKDAIYLFEWQIQEYQKLRDVPIRSGDHYSLIKQAIIADRVNQVFSYEEEDIASSPAIKKSAQAMHLAKSFQEMIRIDAENFAQHSLKRQNFPN